MRPSLVPYRARHWRIAHSELIQVVNDAEGHLDTLATQTGNDRKPTRWTLISEDGREDHPEGSADEVLSALQFPRPTKLVTVLLSAGYDHQIRLTLSTGSADIALISTDQQWLSRTDAWARQTIERFVPRWSWWTTSAGLLVVIGSTIVVGLIAVWLSVAPGVPSGVGLILSSTTPLIAVGYGITAFRPRVLVGDAGAARTRRFLVQVAWLVAGVVLGAVGARLLDVLLPPPTP